MLKRKISKKLEEYFKSDTDKILLIEGARQVGKSYIIRETAKEHFPNYIELNFAEDAAGDCLFENVRSVKDFYFRISTIAGDRMQGREDTLVFLDEIQVYPEMLTLLKFLRQENRFRYIASGSLLGVTLKRTTSIPIGSIEVVRMYPLDFEEFLYANGFHEEAIATLRESFLNMESLDDKMHSRILDLFHKYLLIGGMPEAVNDYVSFDNIVNVRNIQNDIHRFYEDDASKYEAEASRKLKIRRIYNMIPSNMENKKKRMVIQAIEDKKGKRSSDYEEEFEYLVSSGIALDVKAVPTPVFPLTQSMTRNLLKLYLNDVGMLAGILFHNNIRAIMNDDAGVILGSIYETAVAQELKAHGHELFYYDNRSKGEVDFLIDDHEELSVLPIEVKSGKDYAIHRALTGFLKNEDYHVRYGIVLSNSKDVIIKDMVKYLPIYYVMFL